VAASSAEPPSRPAEWFRGGIRTPSSRRSNRSVDSRDPPELAMSGQSQRVHGTRRPETDVHTPPRSRWSAAEVSSQIAPSSAAVDPPCGCWPAAMARRARLNARMSSSAPPTPARCRPSRVPRR
jgi:hypothetical protein